MIEVQRVAPLWPGTVPNKIGTEYWPSDRVVVRRWSGGGRVVVRRWSGGGRVVVGWWSGGGRVVVGQWSGGGSVKTAGSDRASATGDRPWSSSTLAVLISRYL